MRGLFIATPENAPGLRSLLWPHLASGPAGAETLTERGSVSRSTSAFQNVICYFKRLHVAGLLRVADPRSGLIPRPFVFVAGGRFVKGGKSVGSRGAVPIDFDVAGVAVHKTHHVGGIRELQRLPAVVAAQPAAAGNLADEFGPGRLARRGEWFLRHAHIVGVVAAREAVEPVAGEIRP